MSNDDTNINKMTKKNKKVQFNIDNNDNHNISDNNDLIEKISSDIQICTTEFLNNYPHLNNHKSKEIIRYMFELVITSNPLLDKTFYINFITSQINSEKNFPNSTHFID
jgi:hypothetical protein